MVYQNKLNMKGFTLIEIILVIAIMIIVAGITTPVVSSYLRQEEVAKSVDMFCLKMKEARDLAINQTDDSSFGIAITDSSFTLFKGNSYTNRDVADDFVYVMPAQVTISGLSEIIFNKVTGKSSSATVYTIYDKDKSYKISIDSEGFISR